ncbi:MAG: phosphodiester glycosidase family protein [Clostridia bacterium]|nr:phosphodiester glycosidase family protein [Clostridia bacterium]
MKKTISALVALLLMNSSVQAAIYESDITSTVTEGITHQRKETFDGTSWVKANIIRIDLTNEDLSLKVMTSSDGSSCLSTVKTMAKENNTKVSINADFFNVKSGETNMLGMVYQDGELISTPSKDNFVSFVVTEENEVLFDYFTFTGTLYAENTSLTEEAECELYQINKAPIAKGNAITMITSAWGETVTVPEYTYAMICAPYSEDEYEMISFSWGGEKVTIPQGGAVFIADYMTNNFLNANFATGDIIRVEKSISPDVELIKEASGGNTLLLKDGEIFEFTSNITGKAQRSAMGLADDGKTLILATVDGRETDCPGFTQTDMAEFMLNLGCTDAINLDGGGSTTLVTPDRYTNEQTIQNTVSVPRKVSTGLGVISHADEGEAEMGEMKLSKDTIIAGDSVEIQTVFYDENYNNVPFDLSKIRISCSDPYAIIEDNRVMPTTSGIHTIKVKYKGITLTEDVRVIDDIFAINIYPESVNASASDRTMTVTAYDQSGYSAAIPENLITFIAEGDIIMEGDTVKKGDGAGTVTAIYEGLTSVAVVNGEKHMRADDVKALDNFEGFIEEGEKIVITGAIEESKNLIGRFQTEQRLKDLSLRGDVYALSDEIYDPKGIFTIYRETNGFTQRVIENTRIITIANSKSSSIRLSEENAWGNLQIALDMMTEKNLVLITNEPVYKMNSGEQTVWDCYMAELLEKGVNVFVVSMGEKSEATVKDGVRYLYVGQVGECTNASFDYGLKASSPLTFTFDGNEIKYTFE